MDLPHLSSSSQPSLPSIAPPFSDPTPPELSLLRYLLSLSSDEEDNLKRWSSFIGIVVAITGNILISIALNIQKYAHIRLERESESRRKLWKRRRRFLRSRKGATISPDSSADEGSSSGGSSSPGPATPPDETSALLEDTEKDTPPPVDQLYLRSPYWWVGFVLMSLGEAGNFLAYGFAPASIVSPLGVVALVSNCVIAPVILKEPLRRRDVVGVIVSILGAVVVVWSAEKEETKLGPDQILEAISQTAFEVYFGITSAMIIALMYISSQYGRKTILIDLGLVALFGGYTVLSTKGISSLLSSSFYLIFTYPIAYLFTFILLLTAILQIKYVNRALQRFDSTQVIPTQFVLFTISVILGSAILYRDFETVSPERLTKFCTGCALTFWGVWLISSRRTERVVEDEEDCEEGSIDLGGTRSRVGSVSGSVREGLAIPARPGAGRAVAVAGGSLVEASPARVGSYAGVGSPRRGARVAHRKSGSNLIPGPIVAGYQLKAVMGDFSGRRREDGELAEEAGVEDGGEGRRRSRSGSLVLDLLKKRGRKDGEEEEE